MPVIALVHGDAVGITEARVEFGDLTKRLVRAFNGKEIQHGCSDEDGSRVHEEQQTGVVEASGYHCVQVLLRIAVWIFENTVVNPHGQCADVAGRCYHFDTWIKRGDERCLKSSAARARNIDAIGIDFGSSEQVIHGANAVPDFPSCKICAGEIGEIPEHGVFSADKVVPALVILCIPKLAALSLAHRIPRDHEIPSLD